MKYATSYFCFTSSVFYKDSQKQVTIEGHLATLALQIPTHPMQKQSLFSLFFFSLAAFSLWQGRNFCDSVLRVFYESRRHFCVPELLLHSQLFAQRRSLFVGLPGVINRARLSDMDNLILFCKNILHACVGRIDQTLLSIDP
jgi:hypothetical protein